MNTPLDFKEAREVKDVLEVGQSISGVISFGITRFTYGNRFLYILEIENYDKSKKCYKLPPGNYILVEIEQIPGYISGDMVFPIQLPAFTKDVVEVTNTSVFMPYVSKEGGNIEPCTLKLRDDEDKNSWRFNVYALEVTKD